MAYAQSKYTSRAFTNKIQFHSKASAAATQCTMCIGWIDPKWCEKKAKMQHLHIKKNRCTIRIRGKIALSASGSLTAATIVPNDIEMTCMLQQCNIASNVQVHSYVPKHQSHREYKWRYWNQTNNHKTKNKQIIIMMILKRSGFFFYFFSSSFQALFFFSSLIVCTFSHSSLCYCIIIFRGKKT